MRPLNLVMQGFRSHRDRTEINLEGRSLIAIVGPIGAGKSTILDGVCYALYARTPRVQRGTKSLICTRCDSAEVEFRFRVDGRDYTATRALRRSGSGLHVLTDDAGEKVTGEAAMTRAVEELLGLDFKAFSSSVLLPQGRFSQFLEGTTDDKTKILKGVFRFEQIDAMRDVAKRRRDDLNLQVREVEGALGMIPEDADERLKEARQVAKDASARVAVLEKAMPRERALLQEEAAAAKEIEGIEATLDRLRSAADEMPSAAEVEPIAAEAQRLGAAMKKAEGDLAEAEREHAEATAQLAKLETDSGGRDRLMATRARLERGMEAAREVVRREAEIDVLTATVKELTSKADDAAAELTKAEASREALEEELRALERAHSAHALKAGLKKGDPCPVCEQIVATIPKRTRLSALETLEAKADRARAAVTSAREASVMALAAQRDAERDLGHLRDARGKDARLVAAIEAELAEVVGESKDPAAELTRRIEALDAATARVGDAAKLVGKARSSLDAAGSELRILEGRRHELIDSLAQAAVLLEIPRPKLADDPALLVAKTAEVEEELVIRLRDLTTKVDRLVEARDRIDKSLEDLRKSLDLLPDEPIEAAWMAAGRDLAQAAAEADQLKLQLDQARELNSKRKALKSRYAIFDQLADDLRDTRFVHFLLDEKRRLLSALASEKLKELTGRYRFDDEGSFDIVDEFDGDKIRGVDSLSGGETFLASLALALGLAEAVSRHGGRLQCFFLDEGFGSLDADALDLALDGIERIVTADRLIGLVSHVPALADRVEDKIVLEKSPDGSSMLVAGG